jgi:hypothetical protein
MGFRTTKRQYLYDLRSDEVARIDVSWQAQIDSSEAGG